MIQLQKAEGKKEATYRDETRDADEKKRCDEAHNEAIPLLLIVAGENWWREYAANTGSILSKSLTLPPAISLSSRLKRRVPRLPLCARRWGLMISPYREIKKSQISETLLLMASAKCKPALIGNVLGNNLRIWGTLWEHLGEHFGKLIGTSLELDRNIVGTHWEQTIYVIV